MLDVALSRIVLSEGVDRQYIYLKEKGEAGRGFPIVIGTTEAQEIHRVVHAIESQRPMTHQLVYTTIQALGARIRSVDIVDLRQNTFFAHVVLEDEEGGNRVTVVDARPSDAIALALRARCRIRVAEGVLRRAMIQDDDTETTTEGE